MVTALITVKTAAIPVCPSCLFVCPISLIVFLDIRRQTILSSFYRSHYEGNIFTHICSFTGGTLESFPEDTSASGPRFFPQDSPDRGTSGQIRVPPAQDRILLTARIWVQPC